VVNSLTTTQIGALTATNGNIVYNSTTGALQACVGGSYVSILTGTTNPLGQVLTGYAAAAGTISTSTTILGAFNILGALATGITSLQFTGSSNIGLMVNALTTSQISSLSTTYSNYGAITYDTTLNVFKGYTNAGWLAFLTGTGGLLPLSAGSGAALTGTLYASNGTKAIQIADGATTASQFGTSWAVRTSNSDANFDILYGSTVWLTCDIANNRVQAANCWFDTASSYGYRLNTVNTLYLSSGRAQLDLGGSFYVTTDTSPAMKIGYNAGAVTIDTSNNVNMAASLGVTTAIYMVSTSTANGKVIDASHYYYDSGGHQILAGQQSAIADFSAAGGWTDSTAYADFSGLVTKFNGLLAMARAHGLIAT
jgi:hypothetical protein